MRSTVGTPSAADLPAGRLERAISTPSSGCRRMTGAGVMLVSPWLASSLPVLYGERSDCKAVRVRGEAHCQTLQLHSRIEAPHPNPLPAKSGAREKQVTPCLSSPCESAPPASG